MNLNRIVAMIGRLLVRRAMNWGMRAAERRLARGAADKPGAPSAGERQARSDLRAAAKRARQAARITRRLR